MRYHFMLLTLAFLANGLWAQTWTQHDVSHQKEPPSFTPKEARGLLTDPGLLRALLFAAAYENEVAAEQSPYQISLPHPDGSTSVFRFVRYDLMAVASDFEGIATFYGVNVDQPAQTVFLDWTERGFHAAVRGGTNGGWYIDPLTPFRQDIYQAYRRVHAPPARPPFRCDTEDSELFAPPVQSLLSGDCMLRAYDIAVAATPAFANFHGASGPADAALVQSAIVTALNRVNQIYTQDLSVRLRLIAGNERLYFYNQLTSPYSSNRVSDLILQNAAILNINVGIDNYDLGHVFTQGPNNGRAYVRAACDEEIKGGGATSYLTPIGDPFHVDYVAHEIGHQLGATHTQNNPLCGLSATSSMEPGSGSTIMGYAGICFPSIQDNSDGYFHGRSVEEITAFTENTFVGGACAEEIDNSLFNPVIANVTDHLIPAGTPFWLRGAASGLGGNAITYAWEQYDPELASLPPRATDAQGPLFRSLPPSSNGQRFLPAMGSIVSGQPHPWEVLPAIDRALNFRLTVRNLKASYGCAGESDLTVMVTDDNGPFLVTDPANNTQWSRGQRAQVRWATAATETPAYRSPTVDVLLSVDGGRHFTEVLTATANDGLAEIDAPDLITDSLRVMVRSVGGIFYQISPTNTRIVDTIGPPLISFQPVDSTLTTDCFLTKDAVSFRFLTTSAGGASAPLSLQLPDLPSGLRVSFVPEQPRPGGLLTVTISGFASVAPGSYLGTLGVASAETGQTFTQPIKVTKLTDEQPPGPEIISPTTLATDVRPTLFALANGAVSYQFQVAARADFQELLYDVTRATPNFELPEYLLPSVRYYWRIRSISGTGGCGISRWSTTNFFAGDCPLFASRSNPVTITTGPPIQIVEMKMPVSDEGIISDLDLFRLDIQHSFLNDLEIELESPLGTIIPVMNRKCGSNMDIFLSFDDEASTDNLLCPAVDSNAFVRPPVAPFSTFDGESITGDWTLRVRDNANQDGGEIRGFQLKLCRENMTVLPVSFLRFTATGRKSDIQLVWATAEESSNAGFYIERSLVSAPDAWVELGFVAAGDDYAFTDATARLATDYFYRLRQTDLDGRVTYSELRSARIGGAANHLLLFPNPTEGFLSYRWAVPPGDRRERRYQLTDALGREVMTGQLRTSGGALPLGSLPAGVYFLRTKGLPAQRIVRH